MKLLLRLGFGFIIIAIAVIIAMIADNTFYIGSLIIAILLIIVGIVMLIKASSKKSE